MVVPAGSSLCLLAAMVVPAGIRGGTQSEAWLKWKAYTESLRCCLSSSLRASGDGDGGAQKARIAQLVAMCMELYKEAFHSGAPLHSDPNSFALASIAGEYCTPLEAAFMWIGGWRPTSAITLIFSTLGRHTNQSALLHHTPAAGHSHSQQQLLLSINAALLNNRGSSSSPTPPISTCTMQAPSLSDDELVAVEALTRRVLDRELHLSNELASLQMLLLDEGILDALTNIDITRKGYELMESKVSELAHLFSQANRLRLDILQDLLKLLDPIHSALCCISTFELVYALKSLH